MPRLLHLHLLRGRVVLLLLSVRVVLPLVVSVRVGLLVVSVRVVGASLRVFCVSQWITCKKFQNDNAQLSLRRDHTAGKGPNAGGDIELGGYYGCFRNETNFKNAQNLKYFQKRVCCM